MVSVVDYDRGVAGEGRVTVVLAADRLESPAVVGEAVGPRDLGCCRATRSAEQSAGTVTAGALMISRTVIGITVGAPSIVV